MIEFKMIPYENGPEYGWDEINNIIKRFPQDCNFSYAIYRIGDKTYTSLTDEFIEDFNKIKTWLLLQKE